MRSGPSPTQLETEFADLERRYRAAVIAEGEEQTRQTDDLDAEERELRQLQGKVKLHRYLGGAMTSQGIRDGAELEYNQHLGLDLDQFPLSLLAPEELEKRTTTDTESTVRPRRWVDRIFHRTAARHLGIMFESVSPGVSSHPITTGGGTPAQRGREEDQAAAAWTVGVTELKPTRMSSVYEFTIEDKARLPGLEEALRRDLRMGLTERVDLTVFKGDTGANEDSADIASFFSQTGITSKSLSQANKVKYDKTLAALVELLDGTHAESLGDLRIVASVGWNQLILSTIANSAASNDTIASFLRANGVSWRTRGGIETATTDGKSLAAIGLGRGISGSGVAAIWNAATMIRDPYSGASKGQVKITMHTLWNYALVRASNYAKLAAAA